jgi:hypothetical protein
LIIASASRREKTDAAEAGGVVLVPLTFLASFAAAKLREIEAPAEPKAKLGNGAGAKTAAQSSNNSTRLGAR